MSAAAQRQRADDYSDQLQHASILSCYSPRGNGSAVRFRLWRGTPGDACVLRECPRLRPRHVGAGFQVFITGGF